MIARSPHSARDRVLEIDLRETGLARRDAAASKHREAADHILGAEMEMHRQPVAQRARRRARHGDAEIETPDRLVQRRIDDPVAAPRLPALRKAAGQVQRSAVAGAGALDRAVMGVDAAHPDLDPARADAQPVADRDLAGRGRAGHDQPDPGQRKRAVDRQPE